MIKIDDGKVAKMLFVMLVLLALNSLSSAGDQKRWMIEVNYGVTAIHNTEFNGRYFSMQVSHSLALDNSVMFDFGFMYGSTRIMYGGWIAGVKYRFLTDKIVSPFIHGGVGGIS